jgi:arylsulfatase A
VVFVLVDDLGWPQTSLYGGDFYKTPVLEALSKEGMTFHNAYSDSPVCSPTRAAIQTGKHPARLHLTTFIPGEPVQQRALLEPDWQTFLPFFEYTLGEMFQDAGYETAYFGKWHLSPGKKPPKSILHDPWTQGYGESLVTFKPAKTLAEEWQTPENDGHNVQLLTERAMDFISNNADHPFFLMLSHNSVHFPLMERKKRIDYFDGKAGDAGQHKSAVLAAMIERLDTSIGRILSHLDKLGLSRDTVVIVYSDNGGADTKRISQAPMRGGKGWLYEGGIRVPLIVRWPSVIAEGSSSSALISSSDFFPTFAEILGDRADPDKENLDGKSMLGVLKGKNIDNSRALFWHFPHYHGSGMKPAGAVRLGNYKLIEWYERNSCDNSTPLELYDLSNDPGEKQNLAQAQAEKSAELLHRLRDWRKQIGAQMPSLNPDSGQRQDCGGNATPNS